MPIPEFIVRLRRKIGHDELWLPGVAAVVLRDDEVLLVRRADNGAWTPVTGIVEPGDDVHTTAVREVLEETGVHCAVERLVWVRAGSPTVHANGDRARYLDHTLRCRWVSGEPAVGDDENTDTGWFRLDALPEMGPVHRERIRVALENPRDVRLGP
ncbi:NUDIX hydrolase [Mariniluteicoccus flavus]